MFRRWFSAFWRDNKEKIMQIAKIFGIMILVGLAAGAIFSTLNSGRKENNVEEKHIYNPSKTIISGSDISQSQFKEEDNLVKKFVANCNEKNFEGAYNLLSQDCKGRFYPSLEDFKKKYCNFLFEAKKNYSLQSWVNASSYNTYRVKFTGDFMATGDYDNIEKYEDYITIVDDNGEKKLNINGYIGTENINKKTKTEEFEIEVLSKEIYMRNIIYIISLKNISNNDILLDDLEGYNAIKLLMNNGAEYNLDYINLSRLNLNIKSNMKKTLRLSFKKEYGLTVLDESIIFKRVILNYPEYEGNKQEYENFKELKVDV